MSMLKQLCIEVAMTTVWWLLFVMTCQIASCHDSGDIVERLRVLDVM